MDDLNVRVRNDLKIAQDRIRNLEATLRDRENKLEVAQATGRIETDRVQLVEGALEEFAVKLRRELTGLLNKPEELWADAITAVCDRIDVDVEAIMRQSLAREAKGDVVSYSLVA